MYISLLSRQQAMIMRQKVPFEVNLREHIGLPLYHHLLGIQVPPFRTLGLPVQKRGSSITLSLFLKDIAMEHLKPSIDVLVSMFELDLRKQF